MHMTRIYSPNLKHATKIHIMTKAGFSKDFRHRLDRTHCAALFGVPELAGD